MLILESELRKIIQQMLVEDAGLNEGWKENIGIAAIGLASHFFTPPAHAKPLSYTKAGTLASEIVEDEIKKFDQRLNISVTKAITSVDESDVEELNSQVLRPWFENEVEEAMSDSKNLDHSGNLKYAIIKQLNKKLAMSLGRFKKSMSKKSSASPRKSRKSKARTSYIDSVQSSYTKKKRDEINRRMKAMRDKL